MTDNLEPRRIVHLVEDESGTEMEVYLEVDLDERTFGLLVPTDLAIDVVEVVDEDGEEMLRPLEVKEQKGLRGEINEALKAWDLKFFIEDGAGVLRGDPDEEFYNDCETVELEIGEGETEEFVVLLELSSGDHTYFVLTSTTPELIAAELLGDESARALSDDELQEMEDVFREALNIDEEE